MCIELFKFCDVVKIDLTLRACNGTEIETNYDLLQNAEDNAL